MAESENPFMKTSVLGFLIFGIAASLIFASSCPADAGSGCIMSGDMPCMNFWNKTVCSGQWNEGYKDYFLYIGDNCYCPYSLYEEYVRTHNPCDKITCSDSCEGSTYKKATGCDSKTGQCTYDEGYCTNGCDPYALKCKADVPASGWEAGDKYCEYVKGETCGNSRADCACLAGWICDPSNDNANGAGCAPTTSFQCNDNNCEFQKGENCASCPNNPDCACKSGETCSPGSQNSDNYGCVAPEDPCRYVSCAPYCEDSSTVMESSKCANGECAYKPRNCPKNDCKSGSCSFVGREKPGDCVVSGKVYAVQGDAVIIKILPNGDLSTEAVPIGNGDTYCRGDIVTTNGNGKVWIQHVSGSVSYVGSDSSFWRGKFTNTYDESMYPTDADVVAAKGTIQLKSAKKDKIIITPGIIEKVQYLITPGNKGVHRSAQDEKNVEEGLPPGYGTYWNHYYDDPPSSVIYQFNSDGSEKVTVLEGSIQVVDPFLNRYIKIGAGESYAASSAQDTIATNMLANASVSAANDNIGELPEQPGGCSGTVFIIAGVLLAGLFVSNKK